MSYKTEDGRRICDICGEIKESYEGSKSYTRKDVWYCDDCLCSGYIKKHEEGLDHIEKYGIVEEDEF